MTKLEALKYVYQTLEALGWHIIPNIVSIAVIAAGRMAFEGDVLDINTAEAKRRHSLIKVLIILASLIAGLILQIGLSRADDPYDYMLSVGMALGYTVVGYVAYSFLSALYVALNPVQLAVSLIRRMAGQQEPPK